MQPEPIEVPYSGTWVPSVEHDRIVSSLTEAGRKMMAERDQLAKRCRDLLFKVRIERYEARRMRKDAECYRWLRDHGAAASWEEGGVEVRSHPGMLDAAVDESIDGA